MAKRTKKEQTYRKRKEALRRQLEIKRNNTIPDELSASQLAAEKERYYGIQQMANARIRAIRNEGLTSMALERLSSSDNFEFDIDEANTRGDLISIVTAINVFLSDRGSTVEGARQETVMAATSKYRGKFGNQYYNPEQGFNKYDTSTIDRQAADRAFKAYRRLEEERAALIGRQGESGVYGSENLILAMYDAEVRGTDSESFGRTLLDTFERENNEQWLPIEERASQLATFGFDYDNKNRGWNF